MSEVLDRTGCDWEIIFAEDPSTDATKERVLALRERTRGSSCCASRGASASRRRRSPAWRPPTGDAVVVIDVDLQDPPELVESMVKRWREGYDVVYAQRRTREGETLAKRIVSAVGYRIINRIADVNIPANTGDFRLMSRRVVDEVVALNEAHGFLRGLVALVGFNQTALLYDRDPRVAGASKYNKFLGSLTIGMNGIISFCRYPLQLISFGGIAALALRVPAGGRSTSWPSSSASASRPATRRSSSSCRSSAASSCSRWGSWASTSAASTTRSSSGRSSSWTRPTASRRTRRTRPPSRWPSTTGSSGEPLTTQTLR